MNKLTKVLSVFLLAGALGASVAGVTACKGKGGGHTHDYSYVDDQNGECHEHCKNPGCDTPDKESHPHAWNGDTVCDNCGAEMGVESVVISGATTVRNKEQITLTAAVSPDAVEQGVTWSITEGGSYATIDASTGVLTGTGIGTVTVKATSTKDATKFGTYTVTVTVEEHNHQFDGEYERDTTKHWKACSFAGCEEVEEHGHDGLESDGTGTCTTCGAVIKSAVYEMIPTEILKKEAEFKTTTYADGLKSGIFTILPGTTVRTRDRLNYDVYDYNNGEGVAEEGGKVESGTFSAKASIQYNGQARGFSVNAVAPGKLTFYCDNGSGSKTKLDKQTILLTKPDGSTQVISYFCGSIYAITINCDQVGEYKITRGNEPGVGTTDVYYVKYEANVLVTPITDIEIVDKGKVDYFVGNEFDKSKLQLQLVHEGGLIDPVDLEDENLTIDSSAFDGTTAGKYAINISYSAEGKQFTAQYEVSVRLVTAIELGFNSIIQGANTSVGNQQFINHTVKQLYFKGDELDLDGLTVKVVMQDGDKQLKDIVKEGFTYSGYNNTQAGKQTITFTWDSDPTVTASFDIFVFDGTAADVTADEIINIKVDGTIADAEVGTLDSGAYQFKTIQQSLDFLEALKLDENVKKVVTLAAGTYKEKLEINIPNLTIKGAENKTDAANYLIEWDSLYGENDEGDFPHTTDSTQTVSVREGAVGLVLEGVTISNWYNSTEHFAEKGIGESGEHRALAILIQADKVVIDNCRLLGYQDTIELFTGRQYIKNTYICGRTDFIFGTNNTTYFYKCEIESIVSGGYVTAFKGLNKADSSGNATDDVLYGAIFDDCDFTAPQAVTTAADTAIGRTWGKYAAVAVVNSRIGGHITKNAYGGKPARYVAMSGAEPTDATVKFLEGNNTGDGALNSEVSGMHLIGANDLPNYSDLSKIFAKVNGKVTYSTDWNGSKGFVETAKVIDLKDIALATDFATTIASKYGDLITWEGYGWLQDTKPGNGVKIGTDTVITVKVAGEVTLIKGYELPESDYQITYKDGKATIKFVSATGEYGTYLGGIRIDTAVTPEDSVMYDVTFKYEDEVTADKVEKVVEGDKVKQPADPVRDGYTFLNWYTGDNPDDAFDFTQAITAAVTIKANWKLGLEATEYVAGDVINVWDLSKSYEGATGMEQGVLIDTTEGKLARNGDQQNAQFTNGAIIKVKVAEGLTVLPIWHSATPKTGFEITERDADGYVTIKSLNNGTYIMDIMVVSAVEIVAGQQTEINFAEMKAQVSGHYAQNNYFQIDATGDRDDNGNKTMFRPHSSGGAETFHNVVFRVKAPQSVVDSMTNNDNANIEDYLALEVLDYNGAVTENSALVAGYNDGWLTLTQTGSGLDYSLTTSQKYPKVLKITFNAGA